MHSLVLFFVFTASINVNLIRCSEEQTCRHCKVHEVFKECTSLCVPEPTCEVRNPTYSGFCPTLCVPRCDCDAKAGYIREETDGKCIKIADCQGECNAKEILNSCATCTPEPTCQNKEPVEIPCKRKCFPRCECNAKEGYIRDENTGKCVKNCPACGFKEREGCVPCCPDPTCQNPRVYPCTRPCPEICKFACLCIEGYLRDEVSRKCVPEKICYE